jgi:hypothetical protein
MAKRRYGRNITFRLRDDLGGDLQKAAKRAQRSVSEEVEFRLRRSFYDDRFLTHFLGSEIGAEALRLIRGAMAVEGALGDWGADPARAEALRCAINAVIGTLAGLPLDLPAPEHRAAGYQLAALLLSGHRHQLPPELASYVNAVPARGPGEMLLRGKEPHE